MKKLFTLLCFCLMTLVVLADKQINGAVVDSKGEPVIGASIQVQGTNLGTISDYEGAFQLTVPDDAKKLTVSFIGMQTQEVAIKTHMHIVMHENTEVIQEVVVTGYGNVTKGSYTGSVQAVDAETIEKKSPTEISKALAGEVAGVQVVNTSGQPGTNATIYIRGIGSVNAGTTPLYVVDGVPYDGDVSAIDPGDIASTSILKDATATSLYGSRGANGVVLITTKKGTSGETGKIDVDVKYGANMHLLPMYDVITDPKEYVELAWMGIYNSFYDGYSNETARLKAVNSNLYTEMTADGKVKGKGIPFYYNLWDAKGNALIGPDGKFYDDVNYKPGYENMTSWKDAIFRVGQKMDASVKISGGSEKTTYYTSFGYLKDEGYYIGSDYQRFSVRANVDHQAKKWLKGGLNMAYTYSTMNAVGQGDNMNNGFNYVNTIPAIYPVFLYNEDGSIQVDPKTGGNAYDYGMQEGSGRAFGTGINPAGSLRYDRDNTVMHQVTTNGFLEFKFYKDLKLTVNAGAMYYGGLNSEYTNAFYGDAAGIGRTYKTQQNYLAFNCNQLLEYTKLLDEHNIRVLAGHETSFTTSSIFAGGSSHVVSPTGEEVLELGNAVQMSSLTSYSRQYTIESYLAMASYTYDEKYVLNATYRADGSSKFARGKRWGHFGSIGAAWSFTNESFLADYKEWIHDGKLRLSWGVQGNQSLPTSYAFTDLYSIENVNGEPGLVWSSKGDENVTWERSQQVDLGLEFQVNKYLDAEIDYFYKYTDDMLMPRYVSPSLGYTYYYINGGAMMNQGIELQFRVHAVNERNVKLDFRLNGSHYDNKTLSLPEYINTETEMVMSGGLAIGHSIFEYNLPEYAGIDPETGQAQYIGYYDAKLGSWGTGESAENRRATGRDGNNYVSNVYRYLNDPKNKDADIQTVIVSGRESAYAGSNFTGKKASPDFAGGFGFNLDVYGVTLDVTCSYGIGGYGYDNTYALLMNSDKAGSFNWHKDIRGAWNAMMSDEEKAAAKVPRLSNGSDNYANMGSTRFLTSNSYLSLNNIRLGYSFPKKLLGDKEKFHLNMLSIYVTADNLAIASARKGYNPMSSLTGSSDSYQYTPLSTIMGGIKLQF
ncbi:MAG: SusC/RagA family TonB-linked outer membrane protein [Paludibacteraceae bacterium]|nr:SusC/RagA family TonB-linked outer membrane protein [Paludibacteraceae bacterium]